MKAYTYIEKGRFAMTDKPKPKIQDPTDAIVRVTLGSICTSDLQSSMAACQGRCLASPWDTRWWE